MMLPHAMSLEAELLVYCKLYEHHGRKQGEHHGHRGRGGWALVAWYVLVMLTKIQPDLPLNHRLHQ